MKIKRFSHYKSRVKLKLKQASPRFRGSLRDKDEGPITAATLTFWLLMAINSCCALCAAYADNQTVSSPHKRLQFLEETLFQCGFIDFAGST